MYHRIGRPSRRCRVWSQYISARAFARQMEVLRRVGAPVVPLEAVARHVRGEEKLSPRHVAITMDDGFANLYSNGFPTLQRLGYPFTIFLIGDYIGKTNSYHPPDTDLYEPLLSVEQIRHMHSAGVSFGSHTRNHICLTSCSSAELLEEVAGSRQDLESLLQHPVTAFCYPYGAHNQAIREAVFRAGYTLACSIEKGRNDAGSDPFRLRRINVGAFSASLPVFLYKLARARFFDR